MAVNAAIPTVKMSSDLIAYKYSFGQPRTRAALITPQGFRQGGRAQSRPAKSMVSPKGSGGLEYGLQCSRLVDMKGNMSTQSKPRQDNRKIVGFSLSPDMARDVKAEAGRRGVSLRKLFEEMWSGYKAPPQA